MGAMPFMMRLLSAGPRWKVVACPPVSKVMYSNENNTMKGAKRVAVNITTILVVNLTFSDKRYFV